MNDISYADLNPLCRKCKHFVIYKSYCKAFKEKVEYSIWDCSDYKNRFRK